MSSLEEKDEEFDLESQLDLLGEPDVREAAVRRLFERYHKPLMAFVRNKFPSLSSEDAATASHEVFCEVFRKAEDETLDVDIPLKSLLFTIAYREGVDLLRAKSIRVPTDDFITEEMGKALEMTDIAAAWKILKLQDAVAAVQDEFREFVTKLPGQQKLVASIVADYLPHMLTDAEISDEIFSRWKKRVPVVQVKGAKQALMAKFREIVKKKGGIL